MGFAQLRQVAMYSGLVCLRIKSYILRTGCMRQRALCARGKKKRSHFKLGLAVTFRGDQRKIAVLLAEVRDEASKWIYIQGTEQYYQIFLLSFFVFRISTFPRYWNCRKTKTQKPE